MFHIHVLYPTLVRKRIKPNSVSEWKKPKTYMYIKAHSLLKKPGFNNYRDSN